MNIDLVAKAAEFRLISLLFERPKPCPERAQPGAVRVDGARGIHSLAAEISDAPLQSVAQRIARLDEPTYVSLFGPGGPVSPREAAYRRREDPAAILADVSGFYRAFAFEPHREDPPDHIAVETAFAGWLCLKEAYARSIGEAEAADITANARATFVAAHLAPLAAGILNRLQAVDAPDLLDLAQQLVHRTGAAPVDDVPDEKDDDEVTCGPGAQETFEV